MRSARLIALLLCARALWGQIARPEFKADRVIPSFTDIPLMLAPGMIVSIYGDHLGPAEGCQGYGDQQHWETPAPDNPFHIWGRLAIYPTLLCGVQVKIGEAFAGLLWAQKQQINFQVPTDVPFGGSAEIRVIKDGAASDPATLEFGLERIKLTLDEPAYAGMPVWVRVHTSFDLQRQIQYPLHLDPLRMACETLEVRLNGVPLPKINPREQRGGVEGGNICGVMALPGKPSKSGRLPFHLMYRLDRPGTYEMRFTQLAGDGKTVRERSAWTAIEVLPAGKSRRSEWLRQMAATAPKESAELLSDFLPSLLGYSDTESLPLLMNYLYHPDVYVRQFVEYGLVDYHDKATLVPALQEVLRRKGPNQTVAALLEFLAR
jgi:hypothetical protein